MNEQGRKRVTVAIAVGALGLLIGAVALARPRQKDETWKKTIEACVPAKAKARIEPNDAARKAAQNGLDFLGRESVAWYKAHNCYGCHVHAVTLEAMAVGQAHKYKVAEDALNVVFKAMLDAPDGAHGQHGLSHSNGSWPETAKELGGAAFARWDDRVDSRVQKELLKTAKELLQFQNPDGAMRFSTTYVPIVVGHIQATYLSLVTWRQAYVRTADETWLAPIRKAEAYLQSEADRLAREDMVSIQDLNYALMGLIAAGANGRESTIGALKQKILAVQHTDGGFGLAPNQPPSAFATGQTLYALRLLGLDDGDPAVSKGTRWLITHQQADGGWSNAGSGKAEAMWAVLGLVSVDVMSLSVAGIEDGQHVSGKIAIHADAVDNDKNGGVVKTEIAIDDVPVFGACGASIDHTWETEDLSAGKHIVDITATNAKGKVTRRRIEVFGGAYYLTDLGARFEDDGTLFSLRDVAPKTLAHKLRLQVRPENEPSKTIATLEQNGAQGPVQFFFEGKERGRYVADIEFVDSSGDVVQTVSTVFMHDTAEKQQATFAEVEGIINNEGNVPLANTKIDLVDDQGNVVQSVWTTDSGNYRFKNVDGNRRLRVRVTKDGFRAQEAEIQTETSRQAKADMNLQLH